MKHRILTALGIALLVVALALIATGAYNIWHTGYLTRASLQEAEQMLQEFTGDIGTTDLYDPQVLADTPSAHDTFIDFDDVMPQPDPSQDIIIDEQLPPPTDEPTGQRPAVTAPSGTVGVLVFDTLGGRKVPVLSGAVTRKDLSRGACFHNRTTPPGRTGNTVVFGHRDTVFRSFNKLAMGDTITFVTAQGDLRYTITDLLVVEPGDSRMFQAYGSSVLTLVTCYPFRFVGSAPQRYLVVAEQVS